MHTTLHRGLGVAFAKVDRGSTWRVLDETTSSALMRAHVADTGGQAVAEVLVEFTDPMSGEDGTTYTARACGSPMPDGLWQGWIEFIPRSGAQPLRSGRETTQPNRQDTIYWATGLTYVYLEGALRRARNPTVKVPQREFAAPAFDGPAPAVELADPGAQSVLNPFSVYRKGEALLRRQLSALSPWHLVNIIREHRLSQEREDTLLATPAAQLVELIVTGVRESESRVTQS